MMEHPKIQMKALELRLKGMLRSKGSDRLPEGSVSPAYKLEINQLNDEFSRLMKMLGTDLSFSDLSRICRIQSMLRMA